MLKLFIASLFVVYCNGGALSGGYGGVISSGPVLSGGYGGGYGGGLGGGFAANRGGVAGLGYGLGAGLSGYGLGNGLAFGNGLGYGNGLVLGNGLGLGNGIGLGNGLGFPGGLAPFGAAAPIAVSPALPVNAAIQSRRTVEVRPLVLPQEPVQPQLIEVEPQELPVQIVFRSSTSPVFVQQIHTPGAPAQVESTQSEEEPQRVIHEVLRPVIQEVREVIQPFRRVTQEVRPVLEEVHTVVAKGEGRPRPIYPAPALPVLEPIPAPVAVGGPSIAIDAPASAPVGDVQSSGPLSYGRVPYAKAKAAKAAKA